MLADQPPSYASPATSGQLRRSRYLSEALKQMQQRSPEVYSTATGTNASILADAVLGYARHQADKRADEGLKADRARLGDAVLGGFDDTSKVPIMGAGVSPDLTTVPDAIGPSLQTQARGIFDATGDINTALQFGLGQQRQAKEDARYEQERKDLLGKPVVASAGSHGFVKGEDGKWEDIFSVPDPSAAAPGATVQSVLVGDDRRPRAIMRDASVRPLDFLAQDSYNIADVGGVPTPISTKTGAMGGQVATPEQVAANKSAIQAATDTSKARTAAKLELPQAIASGRYAKNVIDQALASEGFDKRYGWEGLPGNVGIMEPGSPAADAQALLDQVTGQAFLQSLQAMKGSGSVSEREGAAATAAATRLGNHMQSPAAARKAAEELRTHLDNLNLLNMVQAGAAIDTSKLTREQLDLVEEMLESQQ